MDAKKVRKAKEAEQQMRNKKQVSGFRSKPDRSRAVIRPQSKKKRRKL